MSKFLTNLFISKNKNNNNMLKSSNSAKLTHEQRNKHSEVYKQEISPVIMTRKMSLTKSGRMKEKKRKNTSVSEYFPRDDKYSTSQEDGNDINCDNDDDDNVFVSVDDVLKEMHQIGRMEVATS
ncbi:hypothetical protein BDFB_000425 [Asbolus verrucosus]|uniref:Uncharacterized protein n=1 Tax=Asbolus verrucosus TaxID=1661398 RepID=A0A482WCZ0_ASBVE|nr:hypothetical protein BDFB_000425 [Asbolus verrucosus]